MNDREERETVGRLKEKRRRGERLTDREWTLVSYSPFGTAANGCDCASGTVRVDFRGR